MKDIVEEQSENKGPSRRDQRRARRREQRIRRNAKARGYLSGVLAMLKPGELVVDCGANFGKVSTLLAETGADVVSFEPDPYAFAQLQGAVGELPNVTLINAAVGTHTGTVRLMRADNFDGNEKKATRRSTVIEGAWGMTETDNSVEVEQIDFPGFLDAQIKERGEIAFLKMDIEGAELDLLETLHTRDLIRHIRCMVVETHENKFPELKPRFAALRETMAACYPRGKVNLDWI